MADAVFTSWADLLVVVRSQYAAYLISNKLLAQKYTHASGEMVEYTTEFELRKCLSFIENKAQQEANASIQSAFVGLIPARWN